MAGTPASSRSSGGVQAFIDVLLQHSADFANLHANAPVATGVAIRGTITLPPTAFGNNGSISVVVTNPEVFDVDVAVTGILIVQTADGTIWIERDTSGSQTIPAFTTATINFDASGGGAGAGLSWNAVAKQIDIANAGAYSAVVSVYAQPV